MLEPSLINVAIVKEFSVVVYTLLSIREFTERCPVTVLDVAVTSVLPHTQASIRRSTVKRKPMNTVNVG